VSVGCVRDRVPGSRPPLVLFRERRRLSGSPTLGYSWHAPSGLFRCSRITQTEVADRNRGVRLPVTECVDTRSTAAPTRHARVVADSVAPQPKSSRWRDRRTSTGRPRVADANICDPSTAQGRGERSRIRERRVASDRRETASKAPRSTWGDEAARSHREAGAPRFDRQVAIDAVSRAGSQFAEQHVAGRCIRTKLVTGFR
jgi:hypothetical protein